MTGSTGSGKSKFLECLIRQDILNCLEPNHVGAAWLFRWSRHKLVSDWSEEHKGAMMNPHLVYRHRARDSGGTRPATTTRPLFLTLSGAALLFGFVARIDGEGGRQPMGSPCLCPVRWRGGWLHPPDTRGPIGGPLRMETLQRRRNDRGHSARVRPPVRGQVHSSTTGIGTTPQVGHI